MSLSGARGRTQLAVAAAAAAVPRLRLVVMWQQPSTSPLLSYDYELSAWLRGVVAVALTVLTLLALYLLYRALWSANLALLRAACAVYDKCRQWATLVAARGAGVRDKKD